MAADYIKGRTLNSMSAIFLHLNLINITFPKSFDVQINPFYVKLTETSLYIHDYCLSHNYLLNFDSIYSIYSMIPIYGNSFCRKFLSNLISVCFIGSKLCIYL